MQTNPTLPQELALAVVALRSAVGQRGGAGIITATELHARVPAGSDWPATATEVHRRLLPALAARGQLRGVTVRPITRGAARGSWHVDVAAHGPVTPPRPRGTGAAAVQAAAPPPAPPAATAAARVVRRPGPPLNTSPARGGLPWSHLQLMLGG